MNGCHPAAKYRGNSVRPVSCRIHKGGMYSRRLRTGRIRSNLRCHQCCDSRVRRRNLPPARVHPRHRCRGMLRLRNNLLGCSSRRFPGNHSLSNNRRYRSNHNPCNGHLGRGKFHSKSRSKADRIAIPILRLVWRRLNRRITVSTCYPIESSISCSASYRCSSCSCPAFLGVLVPEVCAASSYWQWCCLWSVWLESADMPPIWWYWSAYRLIPICVRVRLCEDWLAQWRFGRSRES